MTVVAAPRTDDQKARRDAQFRDGSARCAERILRLRDGVPTLWEAASEEGFETWI